ncbi:glycosyl transferase family protein [Novosphingobium sp.]|uniref:glycosyl transferase family protein n=1 Tax=Novosphingobium sp. TaxID=1874826 RepID=UPI001EC7EBA5|nr:glycosyl transferase family protein [Novosphingobium sp.]MBK9009456.1 glycosyl transferase family protein [Novosphingobium sp.]
MAGADSGIAAVLQWLSLAERELLLFAGFWMAVGLLDEFAVDAAWIWYKLTGRARTTRLPEGYGAQPLVGPAAVMIPAFQESAVIGTTVDHMLNAWPQRELVVYVGCYRNDPVTIAAAMAGAARDSRLRIVVHGADGPTTKADCLNRLYRALCDDEERRGRRFRTVVLHDAEDMVHPAALQAIDAAIAGHDFVQLPVRPVIQPESRWIAAHYADEFVESHAKAMVVRNVLGAAIPAAGVGCGFSREALAGLDRQRRRDGALGPFAPECLTEDYELGIALSREGHRGAFLRLRDAAGELVGTSSYFPARLDAAVRQKTRWIHGIAFQSWDRMGWDLRPLELWMAIRDRRGPLTALVLAAAYLLLLIDAVLVIAGWLGYPSTLATSPAARWLLGIGLAGVIWRGALRPAFTGREYGLAEGLRAVLRIPLANIIAIMAGRRAFAAYFRALRSGKVAWDKTAHDLHPASAKSVQEARA